jgi:hypothetical protein
VTESRVALPPGSFWTPTMPKKLLNFNSHGADIATMQTTVAQTLTSPKSHTTRTNGTLVRRFAIAAATLYSIIVAATVTVAPELLRFKPLMFLWTFTMITAAATYIAGQAFTKSTSNRP